MRHHCWWKAKRNVCYAVDTLITAKDQEELTTLIQMLDALSQTYSLDIKL